MGISLLVEYVIKCFVSVLISLNSSQTHSNGFQECFIFVQQCTGLVGETTREKAIYSLRGMLCPDVLASILLLIF